MAGENEDSEFYTLMRIVINLGALAVTAGLVALVIATIIVEMD
ncbi:MAG TPA: hypothetical protein VMR52_03850 [Dehalococcoidia bacterium]|nr:hypothetical protein [Dehalococcoidia bacterium]